MIDPSPRISDPARQSPFAMEWQMKMIRIVSTQQLFTTRNSPVDQDAWPCSKETMSLQKPSYRDPKKIRLD